MQLAEEIGVKNLEAYGDSKLIINQVCGEYEFQHEDLVHYHNSTIDIAEKFKNFYIDHVPHQQNAHVDAMASLSTSLALSARAAERVLVYNHDLYCCKFALEDSKTLRGGLQVIEVLETLKVSNLGIDDFLTLILYCTEYYLMTLRRGLL